MSPRVDPPLRAGESETLLAYLDYHRATFRSKVDGVGPAGLAQRIEPSTMTLGGMMKHLTLVEESWFSRVLLGREFGAPWDGIDWESDPDWEWRTGERASLFAAFDAAVTQARADVGHVLEAGGLDALSQRESRNGSGRFSLRWILLHMIEEYARHNGHADLLREAVDGTVGE
jgi:uncharacterized damage-inducible protein DinB